MSSDVPPPYFNISPDDALSQLTDPYGTGDFAAIAQSCRQGREDLMSRGMEENGNKELRRAVSKAGNNNFKPNRRGINRQGHSKWVPRAREEFLIKKGHISLDKTLVGAKEKGKGTTSQLFLVERPLID